MEEIGDELTDEIQDNFKTQSTSTGRRWSKLHPRTRSKRKKRKSASSPMLVDTGKMKKRMKKYKVKTGKYKSSVSVTSTTATKYAKIQNEKTFNNTNGARTFAEITPASAKKYAKIISRMMMKK